MNEKKPLKLLTVKGEDEKEKLLFRLDKSNYTKILDAFENSAGVKVEMVPTKG